MIAETYWRFAEYILGDLAERRDQSGAKLSRGTRRVEVVSSEKRRIALRGHSICYVGEEQFQGSDRPFRLTMAVTALERVYEQRDGKARGAHRQACVQTAEMVLFYPRKSDELRQSVLERRRGPRPRSTKQPPPIQRVGIQVTTARPAILREGRIPGSPNIDQLIEEVEMDGREHGQQERSLPPEVRRVAHVIRVQVREYRLRHKGWEQQFDAWFGAFRSEKARDAEWYDSVEAVYKERIEFAEGLLAPLKNRTRPRQIPGPVWKRLIAKGVCTTEVDVASAVVNLACLYHKQGKFRDAEAGYKRAMGIYQSPSVAKLPGQAIVAWIGRQIANCHAGKLSDEPVPRMRVVPRKDKPTS